MQAIRGFVVVLVPDFQIRAINTKGIPSKSRDWEKNMLNLSYECGVQWVDRDKNSKTILRRL